MIVFWNPCAHAKLHQQKCVQKLCSATLKLSLQWRIPENIHTLQYHKQHEHFYPHSPSCLQNSKMLYPPSNSKIVNPSSPLEFMIFFRSFGIPIDWLPKSSNELEIFVFPPLQENSSNKQTTNSSLKLFVFSSLALYFQDRWFIDTNDRKTKVKFMKCYHCHPPYWKILLIG